MSDNNSVDNNHWFMRCINGLLYLGICVQYLVIVAGLSLVVMVYAEVEWNSVTVIVIMSLGLMAGIIQAERLRRKQKLLDHETYLSASPDMDEKMAMHQKKFSEKSKNTQ